MIKKSIVVFALLAISLTACSSAAGPQNSTQTGRTLNAMSQLAVGTLKLDGTQNAVTKDQAAQLIPMWQVYKQLVASDTSAQEEIKGLSTQIQDAMSSDQRKAISDMKLAQSDVMAFMQPAGGSGQSSKSSTSQGGGFPGGGDPGGMPPDMGGGMPGGGMPGGTSNRQASGTQTANSAQGGTQSARPANLDRVPSPLIDAVIKYLQKVAAS